MAWTQVCAVQDRWIGEEIPATFEQIETLIDDAEDLIKSALPDITSKIESTIPLSRVNRVVARMVIRYLRNPDGVRSRSHTAGAFSENVMYGGDNPGGLDFTDQDRKDLLGEEYATRSRGRAFTIRPRGV